MSKQATKLLRDKKQARLHRRLAKAALEMYIQDCETYKKGSGKLLLTRKRFKEIEKALRS